jgi:hypothetical protein
MGAGLLLVVGGALSWYAAEGTSHQLESSCPDGGPCPNQQNRDLAGSVRTWDALTNVGFFGGTAAIGAGVALLFALRRTEFVPTRPSVSLMPVPGGLVLGGRF